MPQSPTAKQRSPHSTRKPALSLSLFLPISGPAPGQGPPATVSLTSSPALFIADGLTCGSRVENTETKLGAASPPREWPNLYFRLLWKNLPGSFEWVGGKVKLIDVLSDSGLPVFLLQELLSCEEFWRFLSLARFQPSLH